MYVSRRIGGMVLFIRILFWPSHPFTVARYFKWWCTAFDLFCRSYSRPKNGRPTLFSLSIYFVHTWSLFQFSTRKYGQPFKTMACERSALQSILEGQHQYRVLFPIYLVEKQSRMARAPAANLKGGEESTAQGLYWRLPFRETVERRRDAKQTLEKDKVLRRMLLIRKKRPSVFCPT